MNIKKILSGVVATALVSTTIAISSTNLTASADTVGNAWLCFTNGISQQWNAGELGEAISIEGNGDYTLSVDIPENGGAESILLLLISTDINIYEEDEEGNKIYDDMVLSVNSVLVDGVEVAYTGPSDGAVSTENDGVSYRLNILNTWGNSVNDIDGNVVNASNVTVNFSVSGLAIDKPVENTTTADTTTSTTENTTTADTTTSITEDTTTTIDTTTSTTENTTTSSITTTTSGTTTSATTTTSGTTTTSASSSNSTTTSTTTGNTNSSPNTSDTGLASILITLGLASITAYALKKRD